MNNIRQSLLAAVVEAGAAIMKLQQTGFSITHKANNELLTQADLLANDILKHHLLKQTPDYGWLSEETIDDDKRMSRERVWIVDPIDGTIEFANGIPEYAISVALVEQGKPILACVFNPASDELFHAAKGEGAWSRDVQLHCNTSREDLLLLASRSEYQRGEWHSVQKKYRVQQVGSIAYKLALIAAGKGSATFSLGPKSEWDIAAGVLLVTEAGGKATDQHGCDFTFNQKNIRVPGVLASSVEVYSDIVELTHA